MQSKNNRTSNDEDVVLREVQDALSLLLKTIGVYGERIDKPISLCFGNGLCLRDHTGRYIAGGRNKVAKAIIELRE